MELNENEIGQRVLGAQHRRRVGVIINELGRIDIDTRLIKSRSGDVLELAGGCVCHEVRVQSELWAAIAEVARLVLGYRETFCNGCLAGPESPQGRCPACLAKLGRILEPPGDLATPNEHPPKP